MSRSRRTNNKKLKGWLSANNDNAEKCFCQIGVSLLESTAFQSLSSGAQMLYICMAARAKQNREFTFPASLAEKTYGISKRSFWIYVAELESAGFIIRNSGRITREMNIYSFDFTWKGITPASVPA